MEEALNTVGQRPGRSSSRLPPLRGERKDVLDEMDSMEAQLIFRYSTQLRDIPQWKELISRLSLRTKSESRLLIESEESRRALELGQMGALYIPSSEPQSQV